MTTYLVHVTVIRNKKRTWNAGVSRNGEPVLVLEMAGNGEMGLKWLVVWLWCMFLGRNGKNVKQLAGNLLPRTHSSVQGKNSGNKNPKWARDISLYANGLCRGNGSPLKDSPALCPPNKPKCEPVDQLLARVFLSGPHSSIEPESELAQGYPTWPEEQDYLVQSHILWQVLRGCLKQWSPVCTPAMSLCSWTVKQCISKSAEPQPGQSCKYLGF